MSTRQKRNSRFGAMAVPAVCMVLIGYFAYHAINGRYGTEALADLREESRHLEYELAAIKAEREELEARVLFLHDGTLEADMLDERARDILNLLAPNEISILAADCCAGAN